MFIIFILTALADSNYCVAICDLLVDADTNDECSEDRGLRCCICVSTDILYDLVQGKCY